MKYDDLCLLNSRLEIAKKNTAIEVLEKFLDEFDKLKSFRKQQSQEISEKNRVFCICLHNLIYVNSNKKYKKKRVKKLLGMSKSYLY